VPRLTVTVITLNEAAHVEGCLASVAWADEVVVVDSGSSDGTPDLARTRGARVLERGWPGYSAQKNVAADAASHDWILSVDADERVPEALAGEIRALLHADPPAAGYRIPRVSWYLDRWLRVTDWYPDYQLRLYDRRRARWTPRRVHESVSADGPVGRLTHDLEHLAYRDVSDHVATMNRYTTLAAEQMFADGRRAGFADLLVLPAAAFLRNYVLRRGVIAGRTGFVVSAMNAFYVFLKFVKLRELEARPRGGAPR